MGESWTAKKTTEQHKTSFSYPMSILSKLWMAAYLIRYEEKAGVSFICPCKLSITKKKKKKN